MIYRRLVVVAFVLSIAGLALADNAAPASDCVEESDDAARLSCYDRAFGRGAETAPAPMPAATAPPTPAPAEPMTMEDLDEKTAPKKERKPDVLAVGHVTRCERKVGKKYLFYFESGQVWKQISDKRLSFKNCDFNVTVSKDRFGYKMQIDGEKSKIRISRVR